MSLSGAIAAYKVCARAEGQSEKTIKETVACVRRFAAFFGGDPILAEIDADDLRGFILALQRREAYAQHPTVKPQHRPLSPDTIATYVRSIKSFFAFLAREGIIPQNRIATVKVPKVPERLMPILTEDEINSLLRQVKVLPKNIDKSPHRANPVRDMAIMLTLLDTGVRISELCGLRDKDVNIWDGELTVMGKGGRERHVPVGSKAGRMLSHYSWVRPDQVGTDKFWLTEQGRALKPSRVEKRLRQLAEKAGLKGVKVNPHTWRHTSAVFYLRNGGDVFTLQKRLGHRTLDMTRHYANLADSDVKAAHMRHSPADRLKS